MNPPPEPDDLDASASGWDVEPVLAALAEAEALQPPTEVREAVLRRAQAAPHEPSTGMAPAQVYAARVAELRDVLTSLEGEEWHATAQPYTWTVHGLLAHLLAIEQYTAAQLGLAPSPDGDASSHLEVGAELIARELAADPTSTAARWSEQAGRLSAHVGAPGFDLEQPLHLHGWPFRAGTALIARAFELWTHADDVRRATGRPTVAPGATELRTMSSVSVRSLPAAVAVVSPTTTLGPTRVVLTGPGGGTFDLDTSASGGRPTTLLVADVVDYCRVVARRLAPDELECDIEGDAEVVAALLEGARILAV
jgi:uncharacterized protein (TIGR03083 family)